VACDDLMCINYINWAFSYETFQQQKTLACIKGLLFEAFAQLYKIKKPIKSRFRIFWGSCYWLRSVPFVSQHENKLTRWRQNRRKQLTKAKKSILVRSGIEVGRRDGELGPVVDVVAIRGPLEQSIQPVLKPIEQLQKFYEWNQVRTEFKDLTHFQDVTYVYKY
jgi:hypothetical protein